MLIVAPVLYTTYAVRTTVWVGRSVTSLVRMISMSGAKNPYSARRYGGKFRFYLATPESGAPVHQTVDRLMKISGVDEVVVTEGKYGFIVRSKESEGAAGRRVYRAIQGHSKGNIVEITAHYRYVK